VSPRGPLPRRPQCHQSRGTRGTAWCREAGRAKLPQSRSLRSEGRQPLVRDSLSPGSARSQRAGTAGLRPCYCSLPELSMPSSLHLPRPTRCLTLGRKQTINTQLMKTPLVQSPSVLLAGDSQRPIPAPYPTGRAVSRDGPDTAPVLRPQMPPLLCSPGG